MLQTWTKRVHGFDEYDYGARGMFPALMRFSQVDPLAEKYYSVSPYAYCLNNPVKYIDPDGRQVGLVLEGLWYLGLSAATLYYGEKAVNDFKQSVSQNETAKNILFGDDTGSDARIDKAKKDLDKARQPNQKEKNLEKSKEKGIPDSQLGPSGKPKNHNVKKANLKQAKEAARNNQKSNSNPKKDSTRWRRHLSVPC